VNHKIDELVLARPTTLYGAAKLSAGILTERIASLGGLRHIWVRVFSTYGAKDNSGWMIPSIIAKLRSGERPALTAGEQLWDYLHVCDAAEAFVAVATSGAAGVFNLGSGVACPLKDVILKIRDLINKSAPLGFGEIPYRDDQVMCLQADVTKLKSATGWHPKIELDDGLRMLIDDLSEGSRQ
jgi:nucleoside-diphosphate-sugar epimerase